MLVLKKCAMDKRWSLMTSDVGCGGCEMQIKPDVSGQHSNAAAYLSIFFPLDKSLHFIIDDVGLV